MAKASPPKSESRKHGSRLLWGQTNCSVAALDSGGFFGQGCDVLTPLRRRCNDSHLLPVVWKLTSAFQTGDIGSGQCGGLWTAGRSANGHGKTEAGVAAAKDCIHQFCDHTYLPLGGMGVPRSWVRSPGIECDPLHCNHYRLLSTHLLRFT